MIADRPSYPAGRSSRRALERELAWRLHRSASNPRELMKLVGQVIAAMIDRNNAALARQLGARDDVEPGAP